MAVEEHRRIELHRAVAELWGEEVANTLFELVGPSGHELATRADIEMVLEVLEAMDQRWQERAEANERRWQATQAATNARIAALEDRHERSQAATNARTEALEAATNAQLDGFEDREHHRQAANDARLEALEQRLTAVFERGIRAAVTSQTRTLVVSQLGSLVIIAGLAFGLSG